MMTPRPQDLPSQLTSVPHWLAWKYEQRPGSDKPTKVPYSLHTGRKASSTNPSDWMDIRKALELCDGKYSGLGFVFTDALGIIGIDLDDCYSEAREIKPWAVPWLKAFADTYSEISPSGNGIKIFARGHLPGPGAKVYVNAKGDPVKEGDPGADGAVEMYGTGRYFTVTGRAAGPVEVTDCQKAVDAAYRKLRANRDGIRPAVPAPAAPGTAGAGGTTVTEGGRHAMLLASAGQWRNAGMSPDAILTGLRQLNRERCDPPKPDFELRGMVDYLATKPPRYRLVPEDFERARKVVNGAVNPAPAPDQTEPPADNIKQSAVEYAEALLTAIIAGKDPQAIYEQTFINAIAAAGTIKQHEAKRRLKVKYGLRFSVKEWDARIRAAEGEIARSQTALTDYILTAEGALKPGVANAITMMQPLKLAYNSFACRVFLREESPWHTTGFWTDYDDVKCAEWCQRQGLAIDKFTAGDASDAIARSRTHYHPVAVYLKGLTWDGVPRLDRWLIDYLGAPDTPYVQAVAAKWLISGVNRILNPGCQADYTLVLEGRQGKRKSTALRVLAGDAWFTDDITEVGTKDSAIQLQGKWLVELSEMDSFRRAEMTTVKAWLVRRFDHFRPPFGRRADDFPRQNVFAATTNKEDWGLDDTGLRRFWPVKVGRIDIDAVALNRDQLWAEAMFRHGEGELSYMAEEMEIVASAEQLARQDQDPWTVQVAEWLANPASRSACQVGYRSSRSRVFVADVLSHCLDIPPRDCGQLHKLRVSRILTLKNWERRRDEEGYEFWTPRS